MGLWDVLGLAAIAVYIFTIRGFGPIGQPSEPPFPIWPKIGGWLMGKKLARRLGSVLDRPQSIPDLAAVS